MVASAGMSAAITESLLESIPAGVAGLRMGTIEVLAARILNGAGEYPRVAPDEERRLAMRVAARSVSDPLTETRGAAAMLERTYRDVRDSGITLEEFGRRLSRAGSLRHRARVRTMLRIWTDYEKLLTRLGSLDPADLLARAAAAVRSGASVLPQILAGFYDMTGAQKGLISALRDVEKLVEVLVPTNAPFAHPFVREFSVAAAVPAAERLHVRQPGWTITESRTREAEIESVCASIATLLEQGVAPKSIGIVARSLEPYDVHLFGRFARQHGFATSTIEETPLAATRAGRGLSLLLRLRERGFLRGDVLEIVRSGLKLKTRISVDKADLETRQAGIAGGTSGELESRASRSPAVSDYVALVAELESLTEKIDARFVRRIAGQFRIESETDLAAVQELDRIGELFVRVGRAFDLSDVLDAIGGGQAILPVRTNLPQVWLGDVMRFRGRSFEHLFAVRMQDDVVPQRRTDDPLLPDAERRELGVREIGNGRDEEQLLFQLLCEGASGTLHFSLAASDGFGKPFRASQLLKAFIIERKPEAKGEVLKNFSRFAGGAPPTRRPQYERHRRAGGAPRRPLQLFQLAGTSGPFDGFIASERVLLRAAASLHAVSPTQLEDFGECPQKFLWKHILKVRDIDDPQRDVQINHRDKGSLDHRILERFYRALTGQELEDAARALPLLPDALADRLERSIDEEFDAFEERIPPYNRQMRAIERRATRRVLREFVVADLQDLIHRGLFPSHFEYRGERPFIIDAGGVPLRVEGMIDRIDSGGAKHRIVDYKSGKALRHVKLGDKIDRGVRLQLAVYAMAVAEFFGADPAAISGAIKPLVRSDADPETFAFELAEKRDGLQKTLETFVAAILRGAFPAFPNESDKDFNSCKYCPVNHSCRTRHDAAEKRHVLRAGEARSLLETSS